MRKVKVFVETTEGTTSSWRAIDFAGVSDDLSIEEIGDLVVNAIPHESANLHETRVYSLLNSGELRFPRGKDPQDIETFRIGVGGENLVDQYGDHLEATFSDEELRNLVSSFPGAKIMHMQRRVDAALNPRLAAIVEEAMLPHDTSGLSALLRRDAKKKS